MFDHPPDRRLDRPEPTDAERREEYNREEALRRDYQEALRQLKRVATEAVTEEWAEVQEARIRRYSEGHAA